MRITRLRLLDFRRHAELELRPAPGLTLVRGPNEAGKSTIERALEIALYGDADGGDLESLRRWGGPSDSVPTVELDFEADRVMGQLVRQLRPEGSVANLRLGDDTITDPSSVDTLLGELTGMPSLAFYRSTAAIRQGELTDLSRDETTLRDRLVAAMSAADRQAARGMRDLDGAVLALEGTDETAPAPLRSAAADVSRLESEVARGETALAGLAADQEALSAARTTLAEVEAQLDIDRDELTAAEEAVRLEGECRVAADRLARLRRAVELERTIAEKDQSHATTVPLDVFRTGVGRLRELEGTIAECSAGLSDEVDLSDVDVSRPESRWQVLALAAIILAVLGVGLVALTSSPLFIVVAIAGLACAVGSIWMRRRVPDLQRLDQLREEQIERRLRGRSTLEYRLREAQEFRDAQLEGLGAPDSASAEAILATEEQLATDVEKARAELTSIVGATPPAEPLIAQEARAATAAEEARRAFAATGELAADPRVRLDATAAAVRGDEAARARVRDAVIAAEVRVASNPADAEAVAVSIETLAAARDRQEGVERRHRVLAGALSALRDAERVTTRRAARFLEERMGRDLARVTGGRYAQVRADEETLAISVWSGEREGWVDARTLSEGTLDQVYMAARLALVRLLTQERRPPLVLDDPFVTFDDERAVRALRVLRELSSEHQVIYLTASSRYDAAADAVVVLPGPGRGGSSRAPEGEAGVAATPAADAGGPDVGGAAAVTETAEIAVPEASVVARDVFPAEALPEAVTLPVAEALPEAEAIPEPDVAGVAEVAVVAPGEPITTDELGTPAAAAAEAATAPAVDVTAAPAVESATLEPAEGPTGSDVGNGGGDTPYPRAFG